MNDIEFCQTKCNVTCSVFKDSGRFSNYIIGSTEVKVNIAILLMQEAAARHVHEVLAVALRAPFPPGN